MCGLNWARRVGSTMSEQGGQVLEHVERRHFPGQLCESEKKNQPLLEVPGCLFGIWNPAGVWLKAGILHPSQKDQPDLHWACLWSRGPGKENWVTVFPWTFL